MSILTEKSTEYINDYENRKKDFLNEYEATEIDFLEEELGLYRCIMGDLEDPEGALEGFPSSGSLWPELRTLYEQDYDNVYYSTKRKIEFLETKKEEILVMMNHQELNKHKKQGAEDLEITGSLEMIFKELKLIEPCLKVLRDVDPMILNEENEIIAEKSSLCVWINVLQEKGFIHNLSNEHYVQALKNTFNNFTMEKSLFDKFNPRATEKYKLQLMQKLSELSI